MNWPLRLFCNKWFLWLFIFLLTMCTLRMCSSVYNFGICRGERTSAHCQSRWQKSQTLKKSWQTSLQTSLHWRRVYLPILSCFVISHLSQMLSCTLNVQYSYHLTDIDCWQMCVCNNQWLYSRILNCPMQSRGNTKPTMKQSNINPKLLGCLWSIVRVEDYILLYSKKKHRKQIGLILLIH